MKKRADIISALFSCVYKLPFILILALTTGCSSHFLDDRVGYADSLASSHDWLPVNIKAPPFVLRSYMPKSRPASVNVLNIYLEGDGLAWVSRYKPAMDPTPDDPVALKLALLDTQAAVAYLARPCQYTMSLDRSDCTTMQWTNARYSDEIIRSMDSAVTRLKAIYKATRIRLIGYSGGGVIAALLVARRNDVMQFVSIASNLDTTYWTNLHGVSPLWGSLNPATLKNLAQVPQIHFIGQNDKNVPRAVVESYLRSIGRKFGGTLFNVAGADHECCWLEKWPMLSEQWANAHD